MSSLLPLNNYSILNFLYSTHDNFAKSKTYSLGQKEKMRKKELYYKFPNIATI